MAGNLDPRTSPPVSNAQTTNYAPSQNSQGNVGCTFNQHVHLIQTPAAGIELSAAITEHDGTVETKADVVSQHLQNVDVEKFLRQHLSFLCKKTKNLPDFLVCLVSSGVVSEQEADKYRPLPAFEQNQALYHIVGQTGKGEKLVQALVESENQHIIDEMYKWIKNKN